MNILYLDDMPERHKAFQTRVAPNLSVDYAWDAKAAKALLGVDRVYDVAFLDHDLGNRIYVDSGDENSGSEVCRFIVTMPAERRPKLAVLHSFNDGGAREMASILRPAGVRSIRAMHGWPSFWAILDGLEFNMVLTRKVA